MLQDIINTVAPFDLTHLRAFIDASYTVYLRICVETTITLCIHLHKTPHSVTLSYLPPIYECMYRKYTIYAVFYRTKVQHNHRSF